MTASQGQPNRDGIALSSDPTFTSRSRSGRSSGESEEKRVLPTSEAYSDAGSTPGGALAEGVPVLPDDRLVVERRGFAEVQPLVHPARLLQEDPAEHSLGLGPDAGSARIDTPRAQLELIVMTERVTNWFAAMAQAMTGAGTVPRAFAEDGASAHRLVDALSRDLESAPAPDPSIKAQMVRLVWTGDHADVARRLQGLVEQPARTAAH